MLFKLTVPVFFVAAIAACTPEDRQQESAVEATRTFTGVWLYQFEGSTFLEGAGDVPDSEIQPQDAAWLELHPEDVDPGHLHPGIEDASQDYDRYDTDRECYPTFAFAVSFQGKRTTYAVDRFGLPGGGHLGLWGADISVEKIVSLEALAGGIC